MKKTILSAVVVALMAVSAIAQNNNNNNNSFATANAAIRSQCGNAQGNLQSNSSVVSSCLSGGSVTNYTFYKTPNCPPNTFCIAVIIPVGTVQIGCDGSVVSVSCDTKRTK